MKLSQEAIKSSLLWLSSDRTGSSSKALASFMFGKRDGCFSTPWDAGDFGRCCSFLNCHEEIKEAFKEMNVDGMGPRWKAIQESFGLLETIYLDLCGLCGYKIGVEDHHSCGEYSLEIKTKRKEFRNILDKCNAIEDKKDKSIHIKV